MSDSSPNECKEKPFYAGVGTLVSKQIVDNKLQYEVNLWLNFATCGKVDEIRANIVTVREDALGNPQLINFSFKNLNRALELAGSPTRVPSDDDMQKKQTCFSSNLARIVVELSGKISVDGGIGPLGNDAKDPGIADRDDRMIFHQSNVTSLDTIASVIKSDLSRCISGKGR
jgi:hypothetical protein